PGGGDRRAPDADRRVQGDRIGADHGPPLLAALGGRLRDRARHDGDRPGAGARRPFRPRARCRRLRGCRALHVARRRCHPADPRLPSRARRGLHLRAGREGGADPPGLHPRGHPPQRRHPRRLAPGRRGGQRADRGVSLARWDWDRL
ncbi:MAG: hypothetical protein AVDCRST_MAG88-2345, partial [uncultured Thermomicrobiales bacterium]